MSDLPSAEAILRDIEFELIQGAVSSDDLGRSIQTVRQHQNSLRGEFFQSGEKGVADQELAARLFQINDMLITLLQEMAGRVQRLEVELRRTSGLLPERPPAGTTARTLADGEQPPDTLSPPVSPLWRPGGVDGDPHRWPPAAVENAMGGDALHVDLEVRGARVPLVGALLNRVRNALHSLPLFYVRRLAGKQAAVNETYGDWVLHLNRLSQQQQQQIESLRSQLAALQAWQAGGGQPPSGVEGG
jgi:hypothetical protein